MSAAPPRRVIALLAGQAFAFGLSESLLLIVANAIFLDAYGSKWLPLTYVGIAVVGTLAAAGVARTVRRWPLPRVALVAEGAVALLFVAAWAVLTSSGGAWVSAPLLVLFPVLLQIGFIFVGGQAGRLLDVQQIKSGFPRIVSGFAIGFLAGGLAGRPLLALLGSPDHLLLVAAGAQAGFLALLAVTGSLFADRLAHAETASRRPAATAAAQAALDPLRPAHHRLPGPLGGRHVPDRVHPLRPGGRALRGRREPDPLPLDLHGAPEHRRHPVPRAVRGNACCGASASASGSPRTRRS